MSSVYRNKRFNVIKIIIFAFLILHFIDCKGKNAVNVIVQIHDTPFSKSGKTVSALNITVKQVDIIRSSDKKIITLSTSEKSMNILDIVANNPVVLSDTSVASGAYDQLRLILSDNNTIVVDGVTEPITVPSGEQTGVKLDGPFYLAPGKLFKFDLDFDPNKSVLYTKGQGYKLKPVIHITNTGTVLGIFRGNLILDSTTGNSEIVMELRDDNTTRMMMSDYPDIIMNGFYNYDSVKQTLSLLNLDAQSGNNNPFSLLIVMKELPETLVFPVIQWSLNNVIILDVEGNPNSLNKVTEFALSTQLIYTSVTVNISYPDGAMDGKYIVTQFQMLDGGSPPLTKISQISGTLAVEVFKVPNSYFPAEQVNCTTKAFLFENLEDINIIRRVYGGQVSFDLSGSKIKETTENSWQPPLSFNVTMKTAISVNVAFLPKLNIQMTPPDFTNNQPDISWNAYPGTDKYFMMILVKDAVLGGDDDDGSPDWDVAYSTETTATTVKAYSGRLHKFPIPISGGGTLPPALTSGDIVRIEVYPMLASDSTIDTVNKTGALYMDAVNLIVP